MDMAISWYAWCGGCAEHKRTIFSTVFWTNLARGIMANPSTDMIETRYPNAVYLAATVFDLNIASAMTGGKDPFSMTMRVGGSNPIAVHTRFNRPGFFGVAGIASGAEEASSSFFL